MDCTRCDGLMIVDNLIDMQESSIPMWMKGWRCVSCGNIVYSLILRHRMIQQAGASRLLGEKLPCHCSVSRSSYGLIARFRSDCQAIPASATIVVLPGLVA